MVSREMARPHLKSHKKRVPHGITKTTTEAQEQENILKRDFSAQRPLEKFLTDITEVQCADGKLYVSPIMDLLQRRDRRARDTGQYEEGTVH